MPLVERHIIRLGDPRWNELDRVCWYSKNVYNTAMYRIRQHYFKTKLYLNYYDIEKHFKKADLLPDQDLPLNTVQQVLKMVDTNWRNFFKALKAYRKHPHKFNGSPRIPKYKDTQQGRNIVVYTTASISKPALKQGILKLTKLNIKIQTQITDYQCIQQVRVVPRKDYYVVEVVYEAPETKKPSLDKNKILGIDLGVDNIATLTTNQPELRPLLINGRAIKSINQFYNKQLARLQSQLPQHQHTSKRIRQITFKRNQRIEHYLHTLSKGIIAYMVEHSLGALVIGKNAHWKQYVNIGKQNTQNFVQIPHTRLIEMLEYKAALQGIQVIVNEESYTSKCSFLDNEPIGKHEQYAGKRVRRAVFVSSSGKSIHADVNGSFNIIRKVFPNAFASGIGALAVMPIRIHVRMNMALGFPKT